MLLALALIVVAGVLGGSVLAPIKRMRAWSFQNSRAVYSLWTYFLMPWVVGFATVPHLLSVYPRVPAKSMLICGASGFGWSHWRCDRRAARLRCAATPRSLPTRDRGARVGGGCGRTRRCWPKGGWCLSRLRRPNRSATETTLASFLNRQDSTREAESARGDHPQPGLHWKTAWLTHRLIP